MIRWLEQLFCLHEFTRVTDRTQGSLTLGRHYLECIKCLKQTPGIYQSVPKIYRVPEEA